MAVNELRSNVDKQQVVALMQSNRLAEACALLKQINKSNPKDTEAWFMLGIVHGQLGSYGEAEPCFRKVIKLRPDHVEAHDNLGLALQLQGKFKEATRCHRRALKINPNHFSAWFNMGNALKEQEDYIGAEKQYRKALTLNPNDADTYNNLGAALLFQARFNEAEECFRKIEQIDPGYQGSHINLGQALHRQGKLREALTSLLKGLQVNSADPAGHFHAGAVFRDIGRLDESEQCYRRTLQLKPDFPKVYGGLGGVLARQGRLEEALASYQRLAELEPGSQNAEAGIANVHEFQGKYAEAYERLKPLLQEEVICDNAGIVFAAVSRHIGRREEAIELLERLVNSERVAAIPRQRMHFGLGKLYDDLGQYDQAFVHYQQANSLDPYAANSNEALASVDELMNAFPAGFAESLPHATNKSDIPVFIVGMPRSGTSLVEQILSSHPLVYGAGELEYIFNIVRTLPNTSGTGLRFPQCLNGLTTEVMDNLAQGYLNELQSFSTDAIRVTDKMPHNFLHLGLIELLFPGARVIHCLRDPLDTCLSCYFQSFGARHPYADDLELLGQHYLDYQRLMKHWQAVLSLPMMEVRYEELVADQAKNSRAMIEFCGLEWDEQCLQFYESKRVVRTASYDQVRQPIYTKSMQRWRNYESHLGPLMEVLSGQVQ